MKRLVLATQTVHTLEDGRIVPLVESARAENLAASKQYAERLNKRLELDGLQF